jgi:LacI family transcriptional regulator
MKKLTLEKIAELSGVSRSTVSRVINNHANVREEVRERVWQVIKETGYQPNLAARSLAARRSGIIGLVIPRIVQSIFTDPYFPLLMQGIAQACNASDYTLSLFLFHTEDEEQKLYPRVLRTGFVDGVVISSTQIDDPFVPQLVDNGMAFVVIGRPHGIPEANYVDVANVAGAHTAVSHLIHLGRRRIATITGPLNVVAGIDRHQGYLDALSDQGLQVDDALIVNGAFNQVEAYKATQRLLPHKPDAIFAASDAMAFGALRALHEAGVRVPEEIAVVGFDDLPAARVTNPPLTTVRQPIRRLGQLAVETLIDILATGAEPQHQIVLTTEFIIRETCGANSRG